MTPEEIKELSELRLQSEQRLQVEIARLQSELDKAHRLCSQMIGWQRDAEIAKAKLRAALERLVYCYKGRWFSRVHTEHDITDIVGNLGLDDDGEMTKR